MFRWRPPPLPHCHVFHRFTSGSFIYARSICIINKLQTTSATATHSAHRNKNKYTQSKEELLYFSFQRYVRSSQSSVQSRQPNKKGQKANSTFFFPHFCFRSFIRSSSSYTKIIEIFVLHLCFHFITYHNACDRFTLYFNCELRSVFFYTFIAFLRSCSIIKRSEHVAAETGPAPERSCDAPNIVYIHHH